MMIPVLGAETKTVAETLSVMPPTLATKSPVPSAIGTHVLIVGPLTVPVAAVPPLKAIE